MRKTTYILQVQEKSHCRPSYKLAVETFWLFGLIPIYQRQFLVDY